LRAEGRSTCRTRSPNLDSEFLRDPLEEKVPRFPETHQFDRFPYRLRKKNPLERTTYKSSIHACSGDTLAQAEGIYSPPPFTGGGGSLLFRRQPNPFLDLESPKFPP